jgi:hypothetical protein
MTKNTQQSNNTRMCTSTYRVSTYVYIYIHIYIYTYIYIYIHIIQRCTGESPVIPNPSCKSDHLRTTAVPLRGCRSARRSSSHCLSGFGGAFLLHFCKSHGSFHGIITYIYIYMSYICHIYIYISYVHVYIICTCIYYMYICTFFSLSPF